MELHHLNAAPGNDIDAAPTPAALASIYHATFFLNKQKVS
jgi:hypothetical protein